MPGSGPRKSGISVLGHGLNSRPETCDDRPPEGNRRQRRLARFDDRACDPSARRGARAGAGLAGRQEPCARRHCARHPQPCTGHSRGQCRRRCGSARRWGDIGLHRSADADACAHRGDGRRRGHRARHPRSGRVSHRELAAAERHDHRARARAARRDRRDLREPSQCRRGCRRAVPEGRQRRDPARWLRQLPLLPRDP